MSSHDYVSKCHWDTASAQSGRRDKIMVQNLEVIVNAGTDVWGRRKKQRALISVTVTLDKQFMSASSTDTVDDSTIHYGILSKAIQARLGNDNWMSTGQLSDSLVASVKEVASSTPIYAIDTYVFYPKGSMFGDGAGHNLSIIEVSGGSHLRSDVLYLRNIRIPCLIGVNSNERLQKQPVVVNLWVDGVRDHARIDDYARLETLLFEEISTTEFQTLESMLEWTVQVLRKKYFLHSGDQGGSIRLRIEKPLAVPFADAPAVEITRPVRAT
ncbi:hypothetical protein FB567DRAFT_541831 [Paraphoma chrysanthemicola]|uniref:dihydroneopterin aldolase n=1 Tax=Paraphoma chrysanthemicola TaxID=798071 RepID=A0A8K0QRX6_9PLEO|nr:hypothetical protein FB567DRAFT_541831 [Paraphoma chrysanthemicola]